MEQTPGKRQLLWFNWLAATAVAVAAVAAVIDRDMIASIGLIALAGMIGLSAAVDLSRRRALRWLVAGLGLLALGFFLGRLAELFAAA